MGGPVARGGTWWQQQPNGIFFPIILGPAAIICAGIALSQGDPLARWALGVSIACTVAGFLIGYLAFEAATS